MRRWRIALALLALAALALPTRAALARQLCFADKTPLLIIGWWIKETVFSL